MHEKTLNNIVSQNLQATEMFVDMNSFFASCEQQVNYWLRNRPVAVCVYTGRHGAIISPSIEAKRAGVKMGLRLDEAIQICPELVPLETNPTRYRDFHTKIIAVLRKYSEDVYPRSIDEAAVSFKNYTLIYKNPVELAMKIKQDIRKEVGDWLRCSIGIAPNVFLAKLATDLQKPDGLVMITPQNIDEVLAHLKLTDLPGIARGMALRLMNGGIHTPLELRYAQPDVLHRVCKSIIGLHWHYRLNFSEVDLHHEKAYKSMQAMRQISIEQRKHLYLLQELFQALCMGLEKRMVKNEVYCRLIGFSCQYENNTYYSDKIKLDIPMQDGMDMKKLLELRMQKYSSEHSCEEVINQYMTSMSVYVSDFVADEMVQYSLFENNIRKDKLRKSVYEVKEKFGLNSILKASELNDHSVLKDVIGFGSIKDL